MSTACDKSRTLGTPSTSASMFTGKLHCIGVCLYSWLSTTCGLASRRSSITRRVVSPADSFRTSLMPSTLRSFTSSAIFWPITSTDVCDGSHLDRASTGSVRILDAVAAEDQRAGREVGPLDELHQVVGLGVRVV